MVTLGSNWTFSLYEEVSNEKLLKNDTRFRVKDNGRRILVDQRPKWTLQRDCILLFYEWNSINHVTNQIALIQGSNALEFLFTYNLVHILSMAVFFYHVSWLNTSLRNWYLTLRHCIKIWLENHHQIRLKLEATVKLVKTRTKEVWCV